MKKILVLIAGVSMLTAANSFSEWTTVVHNETDQAIGITWTASSAWAKAARNIASWVRDTKFTFIKENDSYRTLHSGDTLVVKYVTCSGGKPVSQEIAYDAKSNGYGKDGLVVKWKGNSPYVEKKD